MHVTTKSRKYIQCEAPSPSAKRERDSREILLAKWNERSHLVYLNTGTLFGSELDIDYVKVSTSLTSPQITMNNATVANSISVPQMNTNYATVNTSISSPYFDCTQTLNAANVNIGSTAISTVGGNLNVDVQTPDGLDGTLLLIILICVD